MVVQESKLRKAQIFGWTPTVECWLGGTVRTAHHVGWMESQYENGVILNDVNLFFIIFSSL